MRRAAITLGFGLLVSLPLASSASAQSPAPVDAGALEILCAANAPDDTALTNCLAVVHTILVPGSGPSPSAAPLPSAGTDQPGLGFTYRDENLAVTPLRIDWAPPGVGDAPGDGRQWVALFVRYEALTDADHSASDDWRVKDQNGDDGDLIQNVRTPEIQGGQLTPGASVEGWMTFELPAGVTSLDVTYSDGIFGEDHPWTFIHDPSAGPIVTATPMPTPKPQPTPRGGAARTFGDGIHEVGRDIRPGTYRAVDADGCYWARLSGLGGELDDIIANDNASGPAIVTIGKRDQAFESSGCGEWTSDLSQITGSRTSFGEGTYLVGKDIAPGTYRSEPGGSCYWERLRSFGGGIGDIIANDNANGATLVAIKASDKGFSSQGCGTWTKR